MDKNKETCCACGARRDQHGDQHKTNYCPRFVPSGIEAKEKRVFETGEGRNYIKGLYEEMEKFLRNPPLHTVVSGHFDPRVDPAAGQAVLPYGPYGRQWYQWNMRIKQPAPSIKDPFEPVHHKTVMRCEKIDYTEWVDEEDCLTDTTRGGMRTPPKGRIIF